MRIFKILVLLTMMISSSAVSSFAQATAERLEPGRDEQPVKKEGLKLKIKNDAINGKLSIGAGTYAFTTGTAALDDMSTGTTQLVAAGTDDTNSALGNIGFEFFYDGVRFTQFGVNGNGFMRLGAASTGSSFSNSIGTTTNAPKIMPFWDDLCVGANGKIHYRTTGSAPNRKLVVEFQNMQITRDAGCAGAGGGTFQIWLFETTGVVQFVYGTGMVATAAADAGYSVGLQSGAATNFASVTTNGNTVSYTAANNAQTDAIASGTTYAFAPNIPVAPSGLNFGLVTATSMTLNWSDNALNELGYAIYRSTDGINFTFVTSTPANTATFGDSGLTPSTSYTYRIVAFTEGGIAFVSATQSTTPPGNISAVGGGGLWSSPATWVGGVVPTVGDNVTIPTGATVTVDTPAVALSLTVASGGTLTYDAATARTLAVGGNVTVNAGGTISTAATGTVTTHVLSVGGSLTNDGTLDLSTNGNTAGANLTFAGGTASVVFGGSGPTTNVRIITINKGSQSATVELNPTSFTVQGVNTDSAGFLTITSGTFKISGSFPMTNRTFATATYTIPLTGGIWLNNPNYIVAAQAGGTTCANNGLFRMSQGTYNIGVTGADGIGGGTGATFVIEGGTINATRIDPQNAITWTQSGGTINVGTAANTRSNFGTFEVFSTSSTFSMTGGTFNLIQTAVAATPVDFRVNALSNITGGTVNVGTSATATNFNFRLSGSTPGVVIDNTTNAKTATFLAQTLVAGNLTINTGATANLNGFLVGILGSTVSNNGTLTGTTAGSRLYFLGTGAAQTYLGSGVVTPGLASFDVDNALGVTIDPGVSQIVVLRMILFTGTLHNTNKLTLGNGGTTSGIVQIGNTTTPTAAGVFDTAPVFNIGTGGQAVSYLRTTIGRTTGPEINPTRTLTNLTYDDNNGIHQLSVDGGGLTVTGILTLTNGVIVTGSNQLTHNGTATRTLGYVNGLLNRSYTAVGTYTYHVGQNGYAPVLANVTALGTNPSSLQLSSTDAFFPGMDPAKSISRSWNAVEVGDLTADLSFTYQAADVNGNEADYRVYGPAGNLCSAAPCVNTATHVVGPAIGTTSFGRFTAGESQIPTVITTGSISGRTLTSGGSGIVNVPVKIGGGDLPQPIFTTTTSLGVYRFDNLTIGQTYIITIAPKKYFFPTTVRLVTLSANEVFVDFISNP
ncbi:MAG: hypothetical protein ABI878_03185 [Acidobacteriota bacterium]